MYKTAPLSQAISFVNARISSRSIKVEDYVTTDNMLQNKEGISPSTVMPRGTLTGFNKNDILVANIRPYLKKIWFADRAGGCSNDVLVLRAKDGYDPQFVFYSLFRDDFFEHVMKAPKGTKMPRGDKTQILRFLIPDLKYASQKNISSILNPLDAKIALNNTINAELEAIAKMVYDYWFVQFDFPHENGKPYKSSGGKMVFNEVLKREVPEGWEVEKLESYIETIIDYRGKTPKKLQREWSSNPDDIIALSARHIKNGKLIELHDADRVDEDLYRIWMKEELKNGDVLMTSEAPLGEFFYLIGRHKYCLSQRVFAIRADEAKIKSSYLYFELSNGNGYSQIIGKKSGSTVFGIRQDELRKVNVLKPSMGVQKAFDTMSKAIYQKIRNNDYQNEELSRLRDWLLPMLMNGQVTVGKAYEQVAEVLSMAAEE